MSKRIVLLQALAATPADLQRLLQGIEATAVSHRPAPDQWSIGDVLSHLVDVEQRYLIRLRRVIEEERPLLDNIHPNQAGQDSGADAAVLLRRFRQARADTLSFLRDRTPGQWQRPAVHPSWGETTFRFLVQNLVEHDTEHLNQLVSVQQRLRTLPERNAQPAVSPPPQDEKKA